MIDNGKLKIQGKENKREALCKDGLYIVNAKIIRNTSRLRQRETHVMHTNKLNNSEKWHQKFCHVNMKIIQDLSKKDLVKGLDSVNIVDTHCNNVINRRKRLVNN